MAGSRRARSAGFTLSDLVTVLSALLILLAAAVPAVRRAGESSNRLVCASNLKQIGLAALMYVNQEGRNGSYPRLYWDSTNPNNVSNYTGVNSAASFAPNGPPSGGPAANDVSGALYLLLKTQEITADVFVCPSTLARPLSTDVAQHSNWPGRANLSYSYNNPYPTQAAVQAGWKLDGTLGGEFPLAADMNGGSPALLTTPYNTSRRDMKQVNSPNHTGEGQQVLYCDGHVDWQYSPFCGALRVGYNFRDNIYTCGVPAATSGGVGPGIAIVGPAQDPYDAVLLPTYLDGPVPPPPPPPAAAPVPSPLPALLGGLILLVVIVGGLLLVIRLKRPGATSPGGAPPR